jgi:hypothetical protein
MLRPMAMTLSSQCKTLSRWSRALEFASLQCSLHRQSVIYITISASGQFTSSPHQILKSTELNVELMAEILSTTIHYV